MVPFNDRKYVTQLQAELGYSLYESRAGPDLPTQSQMGN